MEDGEVVFLKTQMLKAAGQFLRLAEEIREDDDERALADFFREFVQRGNQRGRSARLGFVERFQYGLEISWISSRWNFEYGFFADANQAGGVALMDGEIRER